MLCPLCQETLQMTERKGVEIDYCPKCRGVWLDRGELQKIIDLSTNEASPKAAPVTSFDSPLPELPRPDYREPRPAPRPEYEQASYRDDRGEYRPAPNRDDSYRYDSYPHKHKKRESWFSELFDWD